MVYTVCVQPTWWALAVCSSTSLFNVCATNIIFHFIPNSCGCHWNLCWPLICLFTTKLMSSLSYSIQWMLKLEYFLRNPFFHLCSVISDIVIRGETAVESGKDLRLTCSVAAKPHAKLTWRTISGPECRGQSSPTSNTLDCVALNVFHKLVFWYKMIPIYSFLCLVLML